MFFLLIMSLTETKNNESDFFNQSGFNRAGPRIN